MGTFKITATTTDSEIAKATKEDLICACYQGSFAPLRSHRRRTASKTRMIAEAKDLRSRLQNSKNGALVTVVQ